MQTMIRCNAGSLMTALTVALTATILTSPLNAQDKAKAPDKKPAAAAVPDEAEAMRKYMELATPGPGHKALEATIGEWDAEIKGWMPGQDAPPTVSKGKSRNKWILGGRYVQQEFSGDMMGMPFDGTGMTAYDNFKKKYAAVWMDSMSTGMFVCEGTADASGKIITMEGKMDDLMTGVKDKPARTVTRIINQDKHVFEMHDLTLGAKSKMMEITYTRKK